MNRFNTLSAFALLTLAAVAQAQVPTNCQRISGEESPVAPDGYEADGTPIFCAKVEGSYEAQAPGYPPAAPNGYGQLGGYAPQAAAQASGGWNGRLNAPLPGSQKQNGYGGAAGGAGMGGSFQGRASRGAPNSYGQGQAGYGQSQSTYGQPQGGASGYGSAGNSGYAQTGTTGAYDPYAEQAGTAGGYDPYAGQSQPSSQGGYPPDAGQTQPPPQGGYDPYAEPSPPAPQGGYDPYGTPPPSADSSDPGVYGSGSGSGGDASVLGGGKLPKPIGNRFPLSSGSTSGTAPTMPTLAVPSGASPVGGSAATSSGSGSASSSSRVVLPSTPIPTGTVPKLPLGNKLPAAVTSPAKVPPKPLPSIRTPGG